ncbi:hypothetical protein BpHYR1_012065 [Brachionus plicatilis]|uniref:Uncharacterized protein n=1 Tax=Brachionus plicatilis TaxID=10195 RepID=A0A3M7SRX2_BRAPC|nr:hypothetical protein BpHYR1_012065 [Brachionus plicatilis]
MFANKKKIFFPNFTSLKGRGYFSEILFDYFRFCFWPEHSAHYWSNFYRIVTVIISRFISDRFASAATSSPVRRRIAAATSDCALVAGAIVSWPGVFTLAPVCVAIRLGALLALRRRHWLVPNYLFLVCRCVCFLALALVFAKWYVALGRVPVEISAAKLTVHIVGRYCTWLVFGQRRPGPQRLSDSSGCANRPDELVVLLAPI